MKKRKKNKTTKPHLDEIAAKISNDIADGIDFGESRATLRSVVGHFADMASREHQLRVAAESDLRIAESKLDLLILIDNPIALR